MTGNHSRPFFFFEGFRLDRVESFDLFHKLLSQWDYLPGRVDGVVRRFQFLYKSRGVDFMPQRFYMVFEFFKSHDKVSHRIRIMSVTFHAAPAWMLACVLVSRVTAVLPSACRVAVML